MIAAGETRGTGSAGETPAGCENYFLVVKIKI